MIRCSACRRGVLEPSVVKDHDVGPLFGLDKVLLSEAPALVCPNCGHVVLECEVVEAARKALARLIIQHSSSLSPAEARFLRETMGLTQAELAQRLQIIRGTITRWEAGSKVGPIQSFVLRTLTAWSLNDRELAQLVSAPDMPPPSGSKKKPYQIGRLN
jgi:YgiT-type zinc finger domain-containing protein